MLNVPVEQAAVALTREHNYCEIADIGKYIVVGTDGRAYCECLGIDVAAYERDGHYCLPIVGRILDVEEVQRWLEGRERAARKAAYRAS